MFQRFLRSLQAMDFEDRVLYSASFFSFISLFFPWLSSTTTYDNDPLFSTAFGFRIGYIGHFVFFAHLALLSLALLPLTTLSFLLQKTRRLFLQLLLTSLITILLLGCFSILLRVTFELANADIRFGMYLSIIGSFVATLYAFLRYEEHERTLSRELFHHPDEAPVRVEVPTLHDAMNDIPPPPPPPPPPPLEQH